MQRTLRLALAAISICGLVDLACGSTASAPVDYGPMLTSITEEQILPEHHAFAAAGDDLDTKMLALEASPTADTLTSAQTSWRAARAALRKLDAVSFGPIEDLGITERIDLAPATHSDIDGIVNGTGSIDATFIGGLGGHDKGFLGIEYLIFSTDNPSSVLPALQGDGAPSRRRTLARAMADEIQTSAHQLDDAWSKDKGNYAGQIEGAGSTSARYPTQRAALDDLVGGVGYALELIVGIRLAEPLGRKSTGSPDPSLDPTEASDSAQADMTASLAGIHALYDGDGLSSRVRVASTALDTHMVAQFSDCNAKLVAIPAPFDTSVTTDTSAVQAAYDSCDAAKATWNTDLTSALGATLKPTDNDGD